ncbi:MAG: hypothetical protein ACPHID_04545 [Thermoplasmatota archaeon]
MAIHIEADGPFEVGIPLPLDRSTPPSAWEDILRPSISDATLRVEDGWVWITGADVADVEGRMRRETVRAQDLVDASWDGETRPLQSLPVFIEGDVQLMSVHWEATTCRGDDCQNQRGVEVCSLIFTATTSTLQPGFQRIPVRTDNVQCSVL